MQDDDGEKRRACGAVIKGPLFQTRGQQKLPGRDNICANLKSQSEVVREEMRKNPLGNK